MKRYKKFFFTFLISMLVLYGIGSLNTYAATDYDKALQSIFGVTDSSFGVVDTESEESLYFGNEMAADGSLDGLLGIAGNDLSGGLGSGFDLEALLSDFSVSDLLNSLIELMGDAAISYFLVVFIIASLWCFLGYRVYPFFVAMAGLGWSLLIGAVAAFYYESPGCLLAALVLGIIFAVLCVKFKPLGAFLIGFVNCWFFPSLISIILTESLKTGLVIGTVIAVICGVITAIFRKPIIIVSSVLNYGPMAGTALACLIVKTEWSSPLQILFVAAGFFVQTKLNNGLLECGSLIAYLKEKFTAKQKTSEAALAWTTPAVSAERPSPQKLFKKAVKSTVSESASAKHESVFVCPHCDTRNDEEDAFCYCCGHPLHEKPDTAELEAISRSEFSADSTIDMAVEKMFASTTETKENIVSSGKLKFSSPSSDRTDSSGSVIIKMGDKTKSKLSEPSENKNLRSKFTYADDFDDA